MPDETPPERRRRLNREKQARWRQRHPELARARRRACDNARRARLRAAAAANNPA